MALADPVTGDVNVSFYDTRNDTTGLRYMTDVYFTHDKWRYFHGSAQHAVSALPAQRTRLRRCLSMSGD